MMEYGTFESDVDYREATLRQFYPGCQCIEQVTIFREELDTYQRQADGTYICIEAPDQCAECLMDAESQTDFVDYEDSDLDSLDNFFMV